MLTRRTLSSLILASGLAGVAGPALAERSVPANRILPYLDRYLTLPAGQRSHFVPAYFIQRDGAPVANLTARIGEARFRTNAEGRFLPLPTLEQWRSGEMVLDVAEGERFSVQLQVLATVRRAAEMPASDLATAVSQANAAVRRAAGVLGFAVPRIDRIVLRGAREATVVDAQGRRRTLPVQQGHPTFVPSDHAGARTVACTHVPGRLLISGDD